MAKGDLFKILQDIDATLNKSSTVLREEVDTYPHIIEVSAKQIAIEVGIQMAEFAQPGRKAKENVLSRNLGITTGATREQATAALYEAGSLSARTESVQRIIKEISEEYAKNVFKGLVAGAGSSFLVQKISGSDTEYAVKVSYQGTSTETTKLYGKTVSASSVFRYITGAPLQNARDTLRQRLRNKLKDVKVTNAEAVFNLGHITAVSEVQISRAVQQVAKLEQTAEYAELLKEVLDYQIVSKFNKYRDPEITKDFEGHVAYVRPESAVSNNLQASYEKKLLAEIKKVFEKALGSNRDWANQPGSDSVVAAIAGDLLEGARKRGAKTSTSKKDRNPNNASLKKENVKRTTVRKVKPSIGTVTEGRAVQSTVNLRALIPILNQRLPEYVRANMGKQGRLVNRSGRFAESTSIIDIAGDVVSYSYMRNPYETFEHQGARDPRALIELSIREMAVGIMNQRFNLRRV